MYALLVGWAIVWVLDGPGLSLGLELVFVGTRSLVCDILSLMLSIDDVFSFEVGGLSRYVFSLDRLLT